MNPAACQQAMDEVANGVAASLRAVDCVASATAQDAFGRLFGTEGSLLPALSILCTLYVAFFAFALMTGRAQLGVGALVPRMLTLGMVLTFATSWMAYQSFVWALAVGAPDQLAGILTGVSGSSTQVLGDKIDIVFAALVENAGNAVGESTSTFSPPGLLWLGATLLLLGTVGLLVTCKIALAILLALGPVFIVLALFPSTRGLFTGWLKGVVMMAFTPLFAVLGGSLMLELSVPILRKLVETPGAIDPKAAMAFFMIGAVHCALMVMVLKVMGTMVAGWSVFGLTGTVAIEGGGRDSSAPAPAVVPAPALTLAAEQARANATAPSREIRLARSAPAAANDAGPAGSGGRRETKVIGSAAVSTGGSVTSSSPVSRARGIGSRFRAAPARSLEKFK
jgi:type IV secretion system protein VirB6